MNHIQSISKNFIKEVNSYFLGLFFSIILTIIPFFLVFEHVCRLYITLCVVTLCALIQFLVHLKYFLHLNYTAENYWNYIFLIFTILIIFIIVSGSIWIMYNLNHHIYYHICNYK